MEIATVPSSSKDQFMTLKARSYLSQASGLTTRCMRLSDPPEVDLGGQFPTYKNLGSFGKLLPFSCPIVIWHLDVITLSR